MPYFNDVDSIVYAIDLYTFKHFTYYKCGALLHGQFKKRAPVSCEGDYEISEIHLGHRLRICKKLDS